ncbi:MAG: hypothetical protein IPG32_16800 [Saprospirales bacterium]|nr:hypothetical protein [Saprospirales bacterium]
MKALIIFMASVFLLIGRLNSQSIFEDALFLKKSYQDNDEKKFELTNPSRRFIGYYFGNVDDEIVNKCLDSNLFLKQIFLINRDAQSITNDKSSPRSSPFLSGNISNLAFGLTDILVERTKTELYTAFFRKFKEDFSDAEELEGLRNLLPNTSANVALIGDNIYQFDLYMNSFRTAFEKDLRSLPENTVNLLEDKDSTIMQNTPLLKLGLDLTGWIAESRHPGEVLGLVAESPGLNLLSKKEPKSQNWVQATRVALFSEVPANQAIVKTIGLAGMS